MPTPLEVEIGDTIRDHRRQNGEKDRRANPRLQVPATNALTSVQRYSGQMSQMDPTGSNLMDEFSYYRNNKNENVLNAPEGGMGPYLEPGENGPDSEAAPVVKKSRKQHLKKLQNPRNFSKIDSFMRFLEDKRVEDASQLEDLQLPRLRLVLNIVFVALGVCFLIGVIGVIVYSSVAGKD